jgi:hypothetical protein
MHRGVSVGWLSGLLLLGLGLAAVAGPVPPPQGPPSPPPVDYGNPDVKTGVQGTCWRHVSPGPAGAKPSSPTPYPGVTMRVVQVEDGRCVAEGKTTVSGGFRLAAAPGKYRVEVGAPGSPAPRPTEVIVNEGQLTEVKITVEICAP